MKTHTKGFKENIALYGRKLDTKIFYEINGIQKVLDGNKIENINIITNTDLLKTVMKQVEFQSKTKISKGTVINVKNGVKVDDEFEYIDFGNFIIYDSYWNVDINSYSHICHDNMLKTMIDYTELNIKYPIKLREYINEIAKKCGLEFANINDEFVNYNVDITKDNFNNGNYTFRDVLDYICELIGGWFIIDKDDKLSIKYPTENEEIYYDEQQGNNILIYNKENNKNIIDYKIYGDSKQNKTSGKNLFNGTYQSYGYGTHLPMNPTANVEITFSDSNNFVANFIGNGYYEILTNTFELTPNTDYTISFERIDTGTSYRNYVYYIDETDTYTLLKTSYTTGKYSINFNSGVTGKIAFAFALGNNNNGSIITVNNIQLEKGNTATGFETFTDGATPNPNFQQEIVSVGDLITDETDDNYNKYKIPIDVRSENLFNGDYITAFIGGSTDDKFTTAGTTAKTAVIKCKPNTSYSIKKYEKSNRFYIADYPIMPANLTSVNMLSKNNNIDEIIIKTHSDANYLLVYVSTSTEQATPKMNIIEGDYFNSNYIPYYKHTINIYLNEPLRKIGKYQDYIDFKNKKVVRSVKKAILDNSIYWSADNYNSQKRIYTSKDNIDNLMIGVSTNNNIASLMSEKYSAVSVQNILNLKVKYGIGISSSGYLSIVNSNFSNGTEFVNDLEINPINLYYPISTPTEETIELPKIELSNIDNIITVDTLLKPIIKLNYETNNGIPTFNGDFLKDYNINFNKKYGAINSVVFSRGLGNDNIYRKDDNSINSIGLHEIKIENNPFLEGDDRENFIQGVYDKLKGLEFYVMDVDSTGITYLDVGDYYKFDLNKKNGLKSGTVKSGIAKAQTSESGVYKCLLLNNEILIEDGLSEKLYTDEPQNTYTNYKTSAPTDKSVKNAIIQVDKNKGEIVLKTNSEGKIVQVRLDADADTGSVFNVDADNINLTANDIINLIAGNSINLTSKNITIDSTNFKVDKDGNATLNNAILTGGEIKSNNYVQNSTGTKINLSTGVIDTKNFKVDSNGNATMNNVNIDGGNVLIKSDTINSQLKILNFEDNKKYTSYFPNTIRMYNNNIITLTITNNTTSPMINLKNADNTNIATNINTDYINIKNSNNSTTIEAIGITTPTLNQTSQEQHKKNFEKLENALDIVENIDIYKYNMKSDKDTDKKHIGFVIGDNYNYSQDITSKNNDGVDIYSFVSVCCKAIQEQQEQIEQLKQEIKSLKERIDN